MRPWVITNSNSFGITLWWSVPKEELINTLNLNVRSGLTTIQANDYRRRFGSNTVEEIKPTGIGKLVLEGIKQPMMILLLSIAALSFLFGRPVEALVMIFCSSGLCSGGVYKQISF